MNIVELKPQRPLPSDVPGILRELADRCERGEVTSLVIGVCGGDYEMILPSSLTDTLVLATLLHSRAVAAFHC